MLGKTKTTIMLRLILLSVFILVFTNFSFAQIRATTESGNKVLLFDNGTWKYEETIENSSLSAEVVAVAAINIDSTREITKEPKNLFYLPSPRLVRYFGESGGNIRCKLGCSNNLGVVKLHFSWEFPVSDGHRYFGWFKEGTKVIFIMDNGQKVDLIMGSESSFKAYEKNNYSMISNTSQPLTNMQLSVLSAQTLDKMEVEWKKKPEEYYIDQSNFLIEILPTVFK